MRKRVNGDLVNFLKDKQFRSYKERDSMPRLISYLNGKNDNRVMVLNGLRRTGKTTMMMQAIAGYIPIDDAMYIRCENRDKIDDIADEILESQKKYVFLDEVTKVPDFIDLASSLSDDAAFAGHKIVMSGTDSLGFSFAKNGELFDRMHEIRTTFIPFSEYARLTGKDLFQYMKYGGTLSDEDYFYNEDNLAEYTNSAIAHNILHTYEYWDEGKHKIDLHPAVTVDDVFSLVNYYIRDENKRFLASSLKEFKASEFHVPAKNYKQRMAKKRRFPEQYKDEYVPNPEPLFDETLALELQEALQIKSKYPFEITENLLTTIRENLIKLDVLAYIKYGDEYLYYFTQPGMRYCHIDAAITTLTDNDKIRREYSEKDISIISEAIRENIEGCLIEDIVLLDLRNRFKVNPDFYVRKYKNHNDEYDVVIINKGSKKSVALEVKRSREMVEGQKRHLKNSDLQNDFERVSGTELVGKAVLYSGETKRDYDGIYYINSSDFLKNVDDNLNVLCPGFIKSEEK